MPKPHQFGRKIRCGACGCDASYPQGVKRFPRSYQYKRQPELDHDLYYCGCQDEGEDIDEPTW